MTERNGIVITIFILNKIVSFPENDKDGESFDSKIVFFNVQKYNIPTQNNKN